MVKKLFERTGSTYKLIMMDIVMPICDGCDSTRMIRSYLTEHAPQLQPLIVCLTSYHKEADKDKAMLAGMDLFHTKPIFKPAVVKILE